MGDFGKRLAEIRKSLNMNKTQFAEYLNTSLSNISRYEADEMGVSLETVKEFAKKLNVNPGWLLGWDVDKYIDKEREGCKIVPLIGTIAAGTPVLAQENIESYEYVPKNVDAHFCLRVKGDSMINARILDGDIVFIRQQPDVENGEIAAVQIDDEATLKRVYKINGSVILRAENPKYPDMVFSKKDRKDIKILGKAVFFLSEVR